MTRPRARLADLSEREFLALTRRAGARLYWDNLGRTLLVLAVLLVLGLVTGFRPLVWILNVIMQELTAIRMAQFFGG